MSKKTKIYTNRVFCALVTSRSNILKKFGECNGMRFGTLKVWDIPIGENCICSISYFPKIKLDNTVAAFPVAIETMGEKLDQSKLINLYRKWAEENFVLCESKKWKKACDTCTDLLYELK